jgi:hypothetical protein
MQVNPFEVLTVVFRVERRDLGLVLLCADEESL